MTFDHLKSDGHTTAFAAPAEARAIAGEELWWPPGGSAGMVVSEKTALQLSTVLAMMNTVASDVAILPLEPYQRLPGGGRRLARELDIDELLSRSPDDETIPFKWRQSLLGHALQHGNGYAEIQRLGRGTPFGLHLLPPETTKPRRVSGRLGYDPGNGNWIEASNVLHIAGIGYDGLSGYNFVRLLREAIGLGLAAQSYGADYFQNGSDSGGVISTPKQLDARGIANLRDGWEGRHGGPGQRHRVAVLEQGATYTATTADPEKTQLLETRKFQVLDVLRAWRVPPHKAGDFSQAHLANIEASNLDYLMTTLMGWLTMIEQEFSFKLLTRSQWKAGFYLEHNVNALLRADIKTRYSAYEIAVRNGWMSRDEIRTRENMNPIGDDAGGNLYTIQGQNVPLDKVGKTPPIPAGPPTGSPTDASATPPADATAP